MSALDRAEAARDPPWGLKAAMLVIVIGLPLLLVIALLQFVRPPEEDGCVQRLRVDERNRRLTERSGEGVPALGASFACTDEQVGIPVRQGSGK